MFGIGKLAALAVAASVAVAIGTAAIAMWSASIREAEHAKAEAENLRKRQELSQEAEAAIQAEQARAYASDKALRKKAEELNNVIEAMEGSCIIPGDIDDWLRSLATDRGSSSEPAPAEPN